MYKKSFKESWKNLKLILFVPDLVLILFTLGLGLILYRISGVSNVLTTDIGSIETLIPALKDFVFGNILKLVIYFVIFAVSSFIVGSGTKAVKYSMMSYIVSNKKIKYNKVAKDGKEYFIQIILLRILIFFIGVGVSLLLAFLAALMSYSFSGKTILATVGILFLIIIAFLKLSLLFRYAIMFLKSKNAYLTLRNSFRYFNKNFYYVIIVFVVIALVNMVGVFINLIKFLDGNILLKLSVLLRTVYSFIVLIWADLFLFYSYKSRVLK